MRAVNRLAVVGETASELIVFSARQGELTEIARIPHHLSVEPYWDKPWLKVGSATSTLWVSRRAFGAIVERLVLAPPILTRPR